MQKNKKEEKATMTCPECGHDQDMKVPKDMCAVKSYKCNECGEVNESKESCAFCAFSDKSCGCD